MSEPLYLSGKIVSNQVYSDLEVRIDTLIKNNIKPGLAVLLIGENPASKIYVRSKTKIFQNLNLFTKTFRFSDSVSKVELLRKIDEINKNSLFHGILVQLPLPKHIDSKDIINSINPEKDVDGFHPFNVGLLSIGSPSYIPCTPKGIMKILDYYKIKISGKNVVVLGRSNIVGRPISILTSSNNSNANATTTICHSSTKNIKEYTLRADIVIVALGIPNFLKANMIKERAVIIDVGINRIDSNNSKGYSIVGDADFSDLKNKISAITPVPGGVGPMTIAMLVENTIESAEKYCARSSIG